MRIVQPDCEPALRWG